MKIAACQLPDVQENPERSLNVILEHATRADAHGAGLVCFPECCLQGYVLDTERAQRLALELSSPEFQVVLERLFNIRSVLIFGLIERKEHRLYNTAVVVQQGRLLGAYQKTKLLPGEDAFTAGSDWPMFDINGLKFATI